MSMARATGTAFLVLLLAALAVAQEREYTPYERERFELDKHFIATVLLTGGSRFTVTEFHLTTGLYRHKVNTGDSPLGLLQPLSNIKRIVRSRNQGWVHLVYLNNSEMHTPLRHPEEQFFTGIKEDGTNWRAGLEEIAEIEVREVTPPQ